MTEQTESEFYVPSEKNVNKAVEEYDTLPRTYVEPEENLAGEEALVAKYTATLSGFHSRFQGSAERSTLETYLRDSDAKWRMSGKVAQQYASTSSQKQNTLSHVASEQFYNSIKLMHSGLTSIMFGDGEDNPAKYEQVKGSKDYTTEEGKRIAEEQTAYWNNLYGIDNWQPKLKSSMLWMLKNAQELISVQWMYRTKSAIERVPGYYNRKKEPQEAVIGEPVPQEMFDVNSKRIDKVYDEEGHPVSFSFIEKTRVVQNQPIFVRYGLKNTLFDLGIKADSFNDAMQKQTCVIMWDDVTYQDLLDGQKDGLYENVDQIKKNHLWDGSDEESDTINTDQAANADQDREQVANGLFRRYHVYMLAPIDYKKKTWDTTSIQKITESVFVGKLSAIGGKSENNSSVCLMLKQLPYHHGRFPLKLINSMQDDKEGNINIGAYNLVACNIEEQITNLNQHIDNKTLMIKTPFVAERGNVLSRDLIFKNGNQVFWVKPNSSKTALTQLQVKDTTATTLPLQEFLKNQADEVLGTTDVIKGAFAGSRTTGTEVLSVREQALQPAIENAKDVGGQYFNYILRDVADLSRQYCDPYNPVILENDSATISKANPGQLYGEYKTKITSIDQFKSDLTAKQALIQFIQVGGYDKAMPFMQETGALAFWHTVAKFLKIPNIFEIFPAAKRMVEAENAAWADNDVILNDPETAMASKERLPKADERHDIHLRILRSQKKKYLTMTKGKGEEVNPLIVGAYDLYIQIHEDFEAQDQQQASQQPQAPTEPSTMSGEQAGDTLSGQAGQLAEAGV